jgi:hypothetical protein
LRSSIQLGQIGMLYIKHLIDGGVESKDLMAAICKNYHLRENLI